MPVYKKNKIENDAILIVWKIEEDYNSLRSNMFLSNDSEKKIALFSSVKRRIEFLVVRKLLQEANYKDIDLSYNSDGAPLLKNSNITISHTSNYVAVIISNKRVGVDIEKNRKQLFRISHKFLNKNEKKTFDTNSLLVLSIIWNTKEAMFKLCEKSGIDFIENLNVTKIDFENKIVEGEMIFNGVLKKVSGSLDIFDNHTMVYLMNV